MEYGKGGLHFKKRLYTKKVPVPDPTVILKMPIKKIEETLAQPITRGKEINGEGSTFIPYVAVANSTEMVKKSYLQVKLQHPSARHIVCAFRVPGFPIHEHQDYQDDEEHGCGAKILKIMEKNSITHCAVFVARYCDRKMGESRYKFYIDAVRNAFEKTDANPYNSIKQRVEITEWWEERKQKEHKGNGATKSRGTTGNDKHQTGRSTRGRGVAAMRGAKSPSTQEREIISPPHKYRQLEAPQEEWPEITGAAEKW